MKHFGCLKHFGVLRITLNNQLRLSRSPQEAISALVDASRQSSSLDWVWLHIANTFPSDVVPYMLRSGVEEFTAFRLELSNRSTSHHRLTQLEEEYKAKFRSLCDFLTYLADRKRNSQLKASIRELLEAFFLEEAPDSIESVLFLTKLFIACPAILQFVEKEVVGFGGWREVVLITPTNRPQFRAALCSASLLPSLRIRRRASSSPGARSFSRSSPEPSTT